MIKKAALIVVTFSALVGAHLCYVQGFAIVAERLAGEGPGEEFPDAPKDSALRSERLARDNFGAGHWTTQPVKLSYYDQAKGSYMYAMDYELSNQGKTMRVRPFAMIAVNKDGRSYKTITSEEAIIDMSQPAGLLTPKGKDKEPQRVTHARLIGKVMIRDDKGTPENRADDLLIGPMEQVDYDEAKMEIVSESHVVIQDQEMSITGTGMRIELRRKVVTPREPGAPPPAKSGGGMGTGFEAKTAFLYKDVFIESANVGSGGVLMGNSRPDARGNTPLKLWCAGPMRVDLPKPPPAAPPATPGAPTAPKAPDAPAEPTFARFEKNVRVIRGSTQIDQLDCDLLRLTLQPDPKADRQPTAGPGAIVAADPQKAPVNGPDAKPARDGKTDAPSADELADRKAGKGSLSGLKLKTALATGRDVWLQSESQSTKVRCTELHYDKLLDQGLPDRIYLSTALNRKIAIEKATPYTDGPQAGSIKELMRLKAADATILDHGDGRSVVTAQGPGEFEQRPDANKSITQRGWFELTMVLNTFRDPAQPAAPTAPGAPASTPGQLRRQVTLTGTPKLEDVKSGATLDARERIVAEFEQTPRPPGAPVGPNGKPADGPTRIKWLKGYEDVHLTTANRTMTAYRTFEAWFLHPEPAAVPTPAPRPAVAAATAPAPAPASPMPAAPALAQASPATDPPLAEGQPDPAPPAPEGAVDGRANHIAAWVLQTPGNNKGEIQRAILRSDVVVHQDPAPGERSGRDVRGERVEVDAQGKGLMKFIVFPKDPEAALPEPKTRLASSSRSIPEPRNGLTPGLARVEFDGKVVESTGLLGLDQQRNLAWSDGPGTLWQAADRGFFDDKGLDSDRSRPRDKKAGAPAGPTPRDAMSITWNNEMRFFGHSVDKFGHPAAKVELAGDSDRIAVSDGRYENRRGVVAKMTNAAVSADVLHLYFDRTIDLSKAKAEPGTKAPAQPQAEMALIEAWGEDSPEGSDWSYKGVDVISRKLYEGTKVLMEKQRIMHTHVIYNKRTGDYECPGPGVVLLYQGKLPIRDRDKDKEKGSKPGTAPLPTVKLTEVKFTELMQGRFGVARDGAEAGTRTGNFTGNVQAVSGIVDNEHRAFDFDQLDRWPDAVFLSSEVLQVRSEPLPGGVKGPARSLMIAEGNAITRTADKTIQGDRITHDTDTNLSHIYADNGKLVTVAEQRSPGQVVSSTRGTSAHYNNKTRQFQVDDPTNMVMYDLKTGVRPKPLFPPDQGGSPAKLRAMDRKRLPFMRTQKTSPERKSFSAGQ